LPASAPAPITDLNHQFVLTIGDSAGLSRLVQATQWARNNGYKVFLGEIGWFAEASCPPEANAIMNYMSSNADVWLGWAYWTGGPWYPSNYMFMLDPVDLSNPVDRPQMAILTAHL
jgi:endoglucanase